MEREDRATRVLRRLAQQKRRRKPRRPVPDAIVIPQAKPSERPCPPRALIQRTEEECRRVEKQRALVALKKQQELRERKFALNRSVDFGAFSDIAKSNEQHHSSNIVRKPSIPRQLASRIMKKRKKKARVYCDSDDRVERSEIQGTEYGYDFDDEIEEDMVDLMCPKLSMLDLHVFK